MECVFPQIPLQRKCLLRWAQQLYYPVGATNCSIIPMLSVGKEDSKGKTLFLPILYRKI